jgi:hypothetical protein
VSPYRDASDAGHTGGGVARLLRVPRRTIERGVTRPGALGTRPGASKGAGQTTFSFKDIRQHLMRAVRGESGVKTVTGELKRKPNSS